jgi:hypothetical protein
MLIAEQRKITAAVSLAFIRTVPEELIPYSHLTPWRGWKLFFSSNGLFGVLGSLLRWLALRRHFAHSPDGEVKSGAALGRLCGPGAIPARLTPPLLRSLAKGAIRLPGRVFSPL